MRYKTGNYSTTRCAVDEFILPKSLRSCHEGKITVTISDKSAITVSIHFVVSVIQFGLGEKPAHIADYCNGDYRHIGLPRRLGILDWPAFCVIVYRRIIYQSMPGPKYLGQV